MLGSFWFIAGIGAIWAVLIARCCHSAGILPFGRGTASIWPTVSAALPICAVMLYGILRVSRRDLVRIRWNDDGITFGKLFSRKMQAYTWKDIRSVTCNGGIGDREASGYVAYEITLQAGDESYTVTGQQFSPRSARLLLDAVTAHADVTPVLPVEAG